MLKQPRHGNTIIHLRKSEEKNKIKFMNYTSLPQHVHALQDLRIFEDERLKIYVYIPLRDKGGVCDTAYRDSR
jgi:hypothetical protein